MFINKVEIPEYKVLRDIRITTNNEENHKVFPLISYNGGGKSTLIQFLFGLLNFSFNEQKFEYLKNLFGYFNNFQIPKSELKTIAKVDLTHNKKNIWLEFFICDKNYENLNFESIIKLNELSDLKRKNQSKIEDISLINKIVKDYIEGNISSQILFHEIRKFLRNEREELNIRNGDRNVIIKSLDKIKSNLEKELLDVDEIEMSYVVQQSEVQKLNEILDSKGLNYIFHFNNNKKVYLVKSSEKMPDLKLLSEKVYLATPKTQVLHFFNQEQISTLFAVKKYFYSSYDKYISDCQEIIKEYFSYDFSTISLIIDAFQKARDNDFKKAIDTGMYGDEIGRTLQELNNLLENKKIYVDNELKSMTFKNANDQILSQSDLSHGELKKLSLYIWIKANIQDDSIVFFDEIDMGLHPKWQQNIYSDLQLWNNTNQYFLATHSPQIISNSYYKNLIVLENNNDFSKVRQFEQAPLESDLNSIVKTIMGAEYIPKELSELREEYLKLFNDKKEDSKLGEKVKEKILKFESEQSTFFQEINLKRLLRK